jgi:hypothetical protein
VELLVALILAMLVLTGAVGFVVASMRWADRVAARADALETARSIWMILEEELRPGLQGRDWRLESEQAIELRAFRGVARVCGLEGGRWSVAWRGVRAPDPVRDSVLALGADGGWRAAPLTGAWSGGQGCVLLPGETARLLDWPGAAEPTPVVVRIFESGRYSVEDRAFRYRRGAGGRQPLTPERIDQASRFEAEGSGVRVFLEIDAAGVGIPFEWRVAAGEGGVP